MENLKFNPEAELDLRRKVIEYIEQEGINDVVFTIPGKKDRPQKSREELEEIFAPYAEIFLEEYAVDSEEDEEQASLIEAFKKSVSPHNKERLPRALEEYVDGVIDLMEGKEVPEYEAMMDRVGLDYKKILNSRKKDTTKAKLLIEAILKAKDIYAAIAESYKNPVEFSGFEGDAETADFPKILKDSFGNELLQKCLISKISYNPNLVNVRFNEDEYLLTSEKFKKWKGVMPEAGEFTYVGESFPNWNTDPNFGKVVLSTPIRFYSFENEDPNDYKYLDHLKPEDKMRAYKLSNLSHEIAHHIFAYLMTAKKRSEWNKLVDKNIFVTRYVEETYAEDEELKYEESFTESVGLYIAVPDYLQRTHPDFYAFIQNNFPEIKSPHAFTPVENPA